jgi:3-hydroxyisobutyrate dehydrogenase
VSTVVGVLGLGRIGRALAGRLIDAGHEVHGWNRTPGRPQLVPGLVEERTMEAVVARTDVVLVAVADDAAHDGLLEGSVAGSWRDDQTIVLVGTISPALVERLANVSTAAVIAAPVLGSPAAIAGGTATFLVAGEQERVRRLDPVWAALGATRDCGSRPADAARLKLLVNLVLFQGIASLAEALALGRDAGVSTALLAEVLGGSRVVSAAAGARLLPMLSSERERPFSISLAVKDLHLALGLSALGRSLPVAAAVSRLYERATAEGLGEEDIAAIIDVLPVLAATVEGPPA